MQAGHLFEHFSIIKDPRQSWKIEHKLFDILLLTICAVIAGSDGLEDIEELEMNDWIGLNNMVISKMASLYMTPLFA